MMQGLIEFLPTIRRIHHGHGIMAQALRDELAAHGARKPLVLLARALLGTAVEARLRDVMEDGLIHSTSFEEVPPAVVLEAARVARDAGVDAVIAVGGGSAIDTAKGLRFALASGVDDAQQLLPAMNRPSPAKGWLPLVAVPTTLSGAEYTRSFSVNDRAAGQKRSHMGSGVSATAIVYDPTVTVATPEALWLGTGFVALDHAIEVYVANAPHPVADALKAESAATLLAKLAASRHAEAETARLDCFLAGWMADHSPLRTRSTGGGATPWSHVLAYELAALAGISYTVTASLTLGNSLRLLAETRLGAARQQQLAVRLGLTQSLPDAVDEYARALGMPTTPAEAGLSAAQLEAVAQACAARASLDVQKCRRVLGADAV